MMKQLLNTLFVMTEDAYLALENDNVVIHQNDKTLAKVPLRSIEESCVSRIRVLRLLLWDAVANWAFLWHSIHREAIITVPC